MIKHIPHSSTYIPYEIKGWIGEQIDLSDKGVIEIFGTDDALIFPVSRLACDVERLEENEPMESVGMGICYTNNANLKPMRLINDKEYIIGKYYRPHHKAFEKVVAKELETYGEAVIIDCHTYRKEPWPYEDEKLYRPEICIGYDKKSWVSDFVCEYLGMYFEVGINTPFAGTIVPLKYINDDRVKSVMIEVRQDMDARTIIRECLEYVKRSQINKIQ